MDRLMAMRVFVTVVEEGSFAAAGRRLNHSAPAVTRAVAELEESVGQRLLTRTTRMVRLTDAGERYVGYCRVMLATLDEAQAAVSGVDAEPAGTLTVTAPVLFGQLHVMPIVAEYLRRFPRVAVQCLFADRVLNLAEESVDVAVRIGELPDSSLHAVRVGRVRKVVVASPDYLARHGTPQQPRELQQGHEVIFASNVTPGANWSFFDDAERPQQVALRPRLAVSTNEAAIQAALAGVGVARLLSYQVAPFVADGRLALLLEAHEPPPAPVHVLHFEGRRAPRKIRAFIDLAVQALRDDPALR
jgi:DNA-binding transcriptional LysR family regulator